MSLKEDLLALIWKYGWKEVEGILPSVKEEALRRSKEIIQAISEEKPQEPEKVEEEPLKIQEEVPKSEEVVIESKPEEEEPKKKHAQEKKKIQREKEKEKRLENEAKGVFAKDLLTEDNLKLWKDKNYSNAYISRELVGCREEDVAKAKKKYNI